jgi:hypothetical protein
VLTGLGAALHASGLVALAGTGLAALVTSAPPAERLGRVLRVAAWGTAAFVGWIAVYMLVLDLPIVPDRPETSPWRPWFADEVRLGRVSVALFSATGARDLGMIALIVGAPLVVPAISLWRRHPRDVRTALVYALPSIVFVTLRWPLHSVGAGIDLMLAGFPALYALAWTCAQDPKRTRVAGALLVSAHLAFWLVLLDEAFDNPRIG